MSISSHLKSWAALQISEAKSVLDSFKQVLVSNPSFAMQGCEAAFEAAAKFEVISEFLREIEDIDSDDEIATILERLKAEVIARGAHLSGVVMSPVYFYQSQALSASFQLIVYLDWCFEMAANKSYTFS